MDLPGAQVANPALMEFALVTAVIRRVRLRRGRIGMFVVPEVGSDRHFLERAIGRSRREGELEGQQQEEENGEEAAHGRIMAEVRPCPPMPGAPKKKGAAFAAPLTCASLRCFWRSRRGGA